MGGVKFQNLNQVAKRIWDWCEQQNIYVFASYIPSKDNKEADEESRRCLSEIEYELRQEEFELIIQTFGTPSIDLFASRHISKCSRFISWHRDPEAVTIDAFTVSWSKEFGYAFPPFSLIPKVLQKAIADKAKMILVVPFWPAQPWFPVFSSLLIAEPLMLHPNHNLLLSW